MPNYRRAYVPGGSFFFTLVTNRRARLFVQPTARDFGNRVPAGWPGRCRTRAVGWPGLEQREDPDHGSRGSSFRLAATPARLTQETASSIAQVLAPLPREVNISTAIVVRVFPSVQTRPPSVDVRPRPGHPAENSVPITPRTITQHRSWVIPESWRLSTSVRTFLTPGKSRSSKETSHDERHHVVRFVAELER